MRLSMNYSDEVKNYSDEVWIINNYLPKSRWFSVNIYRDAKRRGKYSPRITETEVNNCFSIISVVKYA